MSKCEGLRTPQEDPLSQLTWDQKCFKILGHQPGNIQELDLESLHICSNWFLGIHVVSLTSGTGPFSVYVPRHWISSPSS